VTSEAQVRRYGIETIQGNVFDAMARPESFSLLYLNPPYDFEIGSDANRRMEAVFLEHTYRWLAMEGVLNLACGSASFSGRAVAFLECLRQRLGSSKAFSKLLIP